MSRHELSEGRSGVPCGYRASELREVCVKFIPEEEMRYKTQGDWWFDQNGILQIRSSGTEAHQAFLYALHELVEAYLCATRNIDQKDVDQFDMKFERERDLGKHDLISEPGDDPASPYRREHRVAMLLEHFMAHELGLVGYGAVL